MTLITTMVMTDLLHSSEIFTGLDGCTASPPCFISSANIPMLPKSSCCSSWILLYCIILLFTGDISSSS